MAEATLSDTVVLKVIGVASFVLVKVEVVTSMYLKVEILNTSLSWH